MKNSFLIILSLLFLLFGCAAPSSNADKKESTAVEIKQTEINPKYPGIPLAEKGITVVNPQGWETSQMDFHIGYCQQMMSSLEDIDGLKFCECFLNKIQYYYKPIYFKEAYEDQQKWNSECYEAAQH